MCKLVREEYSSLRNDMKSCRELATQLFIYSITVQVGILTVYGVFIENVGDNESAFEFSSVLLGFILMIISGCFLYQITIHKMEQFYIGTYIRLKYEGDNKYGLSWIKITEILKKNSKM